MGKIYLNLQNTTVNGWVFILIFTLWLSTRVRPESVHLNTKVTPQNNRISSQLTSLPDRLCILWIIRCEDQARLSWKCQVFLKIVLKLSFYSTFKKDYPLEKYLYTIKDTPTRRSFTKFTKSSHKLLIEYGRYQNIPHEERHCTMCQTKKVEDEFHFALECQLYQIIRNNTHNILKKIFQMNIQTESKRKLMSNVMSTDDQF